MTGEIRTGGTRSHPVSVPDGSGGGRSLLRITRACDSRGNSTPTQGLRIAGPARRSPSRRSPSAKNAGHAARRPFRRAPARARSAPQTLARQSRNIVERARASPQGAP